MATLCRRCGREHGGLRCDCGPMREIARGADRIAGMILDAEVPEVDVRIAIERLRDRAEALFPGRGAFFTLVYDSRFDRLFGQFRPRRPSD